jgi:hypothetical protein
MPLLVPPRSIPILLQQLFLNATPPRIHCEQLADIVYHPILKTWKSHVTHTSDEGRVQQTNRHTRLHICQTFPAIIVGDCAALCVLDSG